MRQLRINNLYHLFTYFTIQLQSYMKQNLLTYLSNKYISCRVKGWSEIINWRTKLSIYDKIVSKVITNHIFVLHVTNYFSPMSSFLLMLYKCIKWFSFNTVQVSKIYIWSKMYTLHYQYTEDEEIAVKMFHQICLYFITICLIK